MSSYRSTIKANRDSARSGDLNNYSARLTWLRCLMFGLVILNFGPEELLFHPKSVGVRILGENKNFFLRMSIMKSFMMKLNGDFNFHISNSASLEALTNMLNSN